MMVVMKVMVSAIVIGVVSEVSRRFPTYGGLVAALPLVSLLSIIWLYVQGEQTAVLSKFALGVLCGFPATAILLIIVSIALHNSVHLFVSIGLGVGGWLLFLVVQHFVADYFRGIFS